MSEDFLDAYAVLQVSRDADDGAVRAMYREFAKRHHPDPRGGTGGEAEFARVNRARDILLNPAKRAELDRELDRRDRDAAQAQSGFNGPRAEPVSADRGREPGRSNSGDWEDEWGVEAAWTPPPGQQRRSAGTGSLPCTQPPYTVDPAQARSPWRYQTEAAYWPPHAWGPAPYDRVSIFGFISSILCAGLPVGLVLGLIGLYRTRRGVRRGRWAALSATIIGGVTSVLAALSLLGLLFLPDSTSPSRAAVGDCVDRAAAWSATGMRTASCGGAHDAEVVFRGRFDAGLRRALRATTHAQFCRDLLLREVRRIISGDSLRVRLVVESETPARPSRGDFFVCLAVRSSAGPLDGPLIDS